MHKTTVYYKLSPERQKAKLKLDSLVNRRLYTYDTDDPEVITKVTAEATSNLYGKGNGESTYGIKVFFDIITWDYKRDYYSVEYPLVDPMEVVTDVKAREKAIKYIMDNYLAYDSYDDPKIKCWSFRTNKLDFWVKRQLTRQFKNLKWEED